MERVEDVKVVTRARSAVLRIVTRRKRPSDYTWRRRAPRKPVFRHSIMTTVPSFHDILQNTFAMAINDDI